MHSVCGQLREKPYDIQVDVENRVVRVKVNGEITFQQTLRGRRESVQACRAHNINRVMTDMREGIWNLRLEDALQFGMTTLQERFPSGIRFATLARPGDRMPETMVRALSLTGVPVKMVRDEIEAYQFLLSP